MSDDARDRATGDTQEAAPAGNPPAPVWPTMLQTRGWSDYALLDFGHGRKLERYGSIVVDRPEPQAMGAPHLPQARWDAADAVFTGNDEDDGPGRWRLNRDLPETWQMAFGDVRFLGRFMSFRHVGVFPEQAAHWQWMADRVRARQAAGGRPMRILNLFGYTGLASLVPAAAGAEVTHIDASKKAIGWARENQALSGLDETCRSAGSVRTRPSSSPARSSAAMSMTASCSTRRNTGADRRARSGTFTKACRRCCR